MYIYIYIHIQTYTCTVNDRYIYIYCTCHWKKISNSLRHAVWYMQDCVHRKKRASLFHEENIWDTIDTPLLDCESFFSNVHMILWHEKARERSRGMLVRTLGSKPQKARQRSRGKTVTCCTQSESGPRGILSLVLPMYFDVGGCYCVYSPKNAA